MSNVIKLNAPFERIRFANIKPEGKLRKAIILQAMVDATSISTNPSDRKISDDAIEWIFGKSENFIIMCEEAGVEPDYIARRTQEAMEYLKTERKALNHNRSSKNSNS